jgi:hypothetical protein
MGIGGVHLVYRCVKANGSLYNNHLALIERLF